MIDHDTLENDAEREFRKQSIYDKIGLNGLADVVYNSASHRRSIAISMIYGLWTYHNILKESSTLQELLSKHERKFADSLIFKLYRPRYHRAERILRNKYEIK